MSQTDMNSLVENVINYYGFQKDKKFACSIHRVILMKYNHLDSKQVYTTVKEKLR